MPTDFTIPWLRRAIARATHAVATNGGAILGLCAIVLLWAGILESLSIQREQALLAAVQNTSNLARASEEQIIRSIKSADQTLLYMRDSYQRGPAAFDINAWMRSTQALTALTFQIAVVDKAGFVVTSNFPTSGARLDLSDREHFRVHVGSTRDELFISKPVLGRVSHQWAVQLTRKMVNAAGEFDGVVVESLDPKFLSRLYDAVDVGAQGVVTLVGTDGIVRARGQAGGGEKIIGQSLADSSLLKNYAKAANGSFVAASRSDGIPRIFAYRAVRGYDLIVSIGVGQDEVLAGYRANQLWYSVLASIVTVLLLIVSALFVVRQARLAHAREQLRASEAGYAQKSHLLEVTLEHMSQGLMMIDSDRRVQVCNAGAMQKLGLPPELMADCPSFDDVLRWQWKHQEFAADGDATAEGMRRFVLAGGISDEPQTYERTRPNGVVLEVRSTPLAGGGVVRTYTDITARKDNEEVLRAARDAATAASRAKSEFLATMSHEIRSPMSGLIGVLELLRETKLDAEQQRMAGMVHSSARSLLEVLNDILDFSKIEAGALAITLEPARVRDLVTDMVQTHAFAAERRGLELQLHLGSDVPERAEIDPLRVRQILNNLLANAVKFTAAGTIDLTVDVVEAEMGRMLRFAVADTGIGMSEDVIGRLFEPFMQADGSITRDFGGTGLGLCISRRLAQMLDGTLSATSEAGKGSVFTLLLPMIVAHAVDQDAALSSVSLSGATAMGARVLLTDDDPTNRWLSQRQLELLGVHVDVAENGLTALEMLGAGQYDLMITDCHMPGMDGVTLTRAIRAAEDSGLRALPIIGLTADVTPAQRERCDGAGMTHVAIKPLSKAQLAALVALCLPDSVPDPIGDLGEAPERPAVAFDDTNYCDMFGPGDPDGAVWLAEYLAAAASLAEDLNGALTAPEIRRDAVASIAHRLVGSSLTAGAALLGNAAKALEQAAPNADAAALRALSDAVRHELAAARAAILAFLAAASDQDEQLELAS